MKKNKGFTLVELLSVVVILGIVLTIAVPLVSKYILKTEDRYYTDMEATIKAAGMEYVSENSNYLPKEPGMSVKITKANLISSGIIDKATDSNGNDCADANVIVTKSAKGEYSYTACIQCGDYETKNNVCSYEYVTGVDTTAPTYAKLYAVSKTTNSIALKAVCVDPDTGISEYQYSSDGGNNFISAGTSSTYTFTGLTNDKSYSFIAKCSNSAGLSKTTNEVTYQTASFTNPTIKEINKSEQAFVPKRDMQITYNSENVDNPIYYFKTTSTASVTENVYDCGLGTNPGTCSSTATKNLEINHWYKTTQSVFTITITSNGTLSATISDSNNFSGFSSYNLSNIDSIAPICNIIGNDNWTSSNVTLTLGCIDTGGSGCTIDSTSTKEFTASTSTYDYPEFIIKDNAGNTTTCNAGTVAIKTDSTTPTIEAKSSKIGLVVGADYDFTTNLNTTFGPSGGTVVCDPANNSTIGSGSTTINCTATSTTGLTSTTSFIASHSYQATLTCSGGRTLTSSGTCTYYYSSNASVCGCNSYNSCQNKQYCGDRCTDSRQDCKRWECPATGYCWGYCVEWANTYSCYKYETNSCQNPTCGCSNAKSCTVTENQYQEYTCPDGGTYNSANGMCEY